MITVVNLHDSLLDVLRALKFKCSWISKLSTQTTRPRCSRSFKVADFGSNGKHVCDFLLVDYTNLWIVGQIFAVDGECRRRSG